MTDAKRGRIWLLAALLLLTGLSSSVARADDKTQILDTYRQFAAAQNSRDLGRVRSFLLDRPDFLWVTDGMSVWGVDNTIARMAQFQKAKTWRIEPDLGAAKPVMLSDGAAFLHLPLSLVIGAETTPEVYQFLVSVLWLKTPEGWRIAGLLTTTKHP
jgi:ketosteroid isomerase-like protein